MKEKRPRPRHRRRALLLFPAPTGTSPRHPRRARTIARDAPRRKAALNRDATRIVNGADDDRSRSSRRGREERRERPEPASPRAIAPSESVSFDDDFGAGTVDDEVLTTGGGAESQGSGDDDVDESGESLINFADVPTWEEAISYLLNPSQVQAEGSGRGHGASPSGDQPRQTRHYGGRG